MAYIVPNTTLQLLYNVPFDVNHENTMYFATIAEQNAYFEATDGNGNYRRIALELNNLSYQRTEKGSIRIGTVNSADPTWSAIKLVYNASYMRFKNTNFENKWFYAFIDSIEYINNNCVELFYHLDVIQTWIFDWTFNQCMIERTHTPTDSPGQFTYPEGIEHGPYKGYEAACYQMGAGSTPVSVGNGFFYNSKLVIATSFQEDPQNPGQVIPVGGILLKGMPRQYRTDDLYCGVHYISYDLTAQGISDANTFLQSVNNAGKIDGVLAIFIYPSTFTAFQDGKNPEQMLIDVPTNIDGYIPRNKKLLCYPYNILYCTNNQGNTAEYYWENFNNRFQGRVTFGVWGNVSTDPGLVCFPSEYNGSTSYNEDEEITLKGFPMCAYVNDTFKAWLAQNAGTILAGAFSLAGSWSTALVGAGQVSRIDPEMPTIIGKEPISGGPSFGLLGATLGAMGQVFDHKRKPPQAHGDNNGNLQYQAGQLTFCFYYKQIKLEYANIIDEYFDMYGYKIMMHGYPNIAARPCYTFIKTIGCSINANIPSAQSREIESIFDKGIRFWKTSAAFGTFDPGINDNRPQT